jgi:probable rRNA maturation factor
LITLQLASKKHPERLQSAVKSYTRKLPVLSDILSEVRWQPAAGKRKVRINVAGKNVVLVQLISDAKMKKLNGDYRGKPTPTDVLSFAYAETSVPTFSHEPVGEVFISYQTAARQAKEIRQPLETELCVLTIHGTLHAMGYDHERSAAEAKRMQVAEARILRAAGLRDAHGLVGR